MDMNWKTTQPGVMVLNGSQVLIQFEPGDGEKTSFQVLWDGHIMHDLAFLESAKSNGERLYQDLVEIGTINAEETQAQRAHHHNQETEPAETYKNGQPMFAADGTMLDEKGNRSIFDDVDE